MPVATVLITAMSGRATEPSPTRRNPRSRYIAKSIPRQAVVPAPGVTLTDAQLPLSANSFSSPACVQRQ